MFADFFIKRPVFASVAAILILLVGLISIPTLPIAQYPEISPVQVQVTSTYPGASADVVESAVTTILERQINGVEGLRYLSSSSSNDGTSTISATFEPTRNKDIAAVDVQNRVSSVLSQLPETVQQTGVRVNKQSNDLLLAIGIFTENNEYDNIFLSNYADLYLADAVKRVDGVGDVRIFGERRYSMRLWLDPERLASRALTVQDVTDALREQNIQVGAGRIGQQPSPKDQLYQIDLRAQGRLTDPSQFEDITLKADDNGSLVKLRDVGRAELGAENYNSFLRFRGKPAVGLGIYQLPGSNALDVAAGVKKEMERLKASFPPGLKYQVALDTTLFVEESLSEVVKTLLEAIVLVVLVIFVFLQDWRTTLIPTLTIPLALIGTFAFVKVFNFSINSLTLFGLTLATGLVVDDAIIVVENIARLMQRGLKPKEAASAGTAELFSAVIATSLVLMAVFIPVAFFPGATGALYKQFALTIAFSIFISTFLALTLTPSLAGLLLRREHEPPRWLAWFFNPFNRGLEWTRHKYQGSLNRLIRFKSVIIGLFIVSLGLTALLYARVPSAFLPEEDQGYFITLIQGPEGVSLNYTDQVIAKVEKEILQIPEVVGTFAIGGFGLGGGNTANSGAVFTTLKPWKERKESEKSVKGLIEQLAGKFATITEARVTPVNPPTIRGLGSFGGFQYELQDRRSNGDLQALVKSSSQLIKQANQPEAGLQRVFTQFSAATPQFTIGINRDVAKALQVSVDDIFNTLQTALGSQYVNDFNLGQRSYRVYVQADQQYRSSPGDIGSLYVRSERDEMIPLSNLVTVTPAVGAQNITHFNLFRSIEISGSPAPGSSSGDAIKKMQQLSAELLPPNFSFEWAGTALEEIRSGQLAPIIFGLGLVFVFLVLAAQYENYFDPLIIMLAVPLAIFGALLAQSLRGLQNDVYCQIGLVMLIGLASKNSILIVEFANQLREQGLSTAKAAVEASQERLRPILMTAFSAILGFLPLVTATGAGAGSRRSLGTAVFGGLLVATLLSLFVVPVLYIIVTGLRDRLSHKRRGGKPSDGPPNEAPREPVSAQADH